MAAMINNVDEHFGSIGSRGRPTLASYN